MLTLIWFETIFNLISKDFIMYAESCNYFEKFVCSRNGNE